MVKSNQTKCIKSNKAICTTVCLLLHEKSDVQNENKIRKKQFIVERYEVNATVKSGDSLGLLKMIFRKSSNTKHNIMPLGDGVIFKIKKTQCHLAVSRKLCISLSVQLKGQW